jgi:hypothetical protein
MYSDWNETKMVKFKKIFFFLVNKNSIHIRVLSDQEREEKYGARRKRVRENRPPDEDPDIHKYLNKEEKLLIEDIAHALYQSRALVFLFSIKEHKVTGKFRRDLNPSWV